MFRVLRFFYIFFLVLPFFLNAQVTSGLVLHLDARDTNSYSGSGSVWSDLSGNNYNATISGATFNGNGKYFYFDGSNDYVNTNKTASQFGIYNTNYTMEAVFRVPNTSRGDNMVFGQIKPVPEGDFITVPEAVRSILVITVRI